MIDRTTPYLIMLGVIYFKIHTKNMTHEQKFQYEGLAQHLIGEIKKL